MSRLINMKQGSSPVLVAVDGGMEVEKRLADMGFLPGETVHVLHNTGHGPVTVMIKGSKVALGHGLAQKIRVKEA
jgi:Fe2+ transport system protein FeoA